MAKQLEIRCRRNSYIRAGFHFAQGLNTLPLDAVSDKQRKALEEDPALTVTERELNPEPASVTAPVQGMAEGGPSHSAPAQNTSESETTSVKQESTDEAGATHVVPADEALLGDITKVKTKYLGDAWTRDVKKAVADQIEGLTVEAITVTDDDGVAVLQWTLNDASRELRVPAEAAN